jgi:hypothetical protein
VIFFLLYARANFNIIEPSFIEPSFIEPNIIEPNIIEPPENIEKEGEGLKKSN